MIVFDAVDVTFVRTSAKLETDFTSPVLVLVVLFFNSTKVCHFVSTSTINFFIMKYT